MPTRSSTETQASKPSSSTEKIVNLARLKALKAALATEPHVSEGEAVRRLRVAEAKLAEVKLAERKGDLLDAHRVHSYISGMIIRAAEILDRLPDELADRLAQLGDPCECKQLLASELNRARNELSEYRGTTGPPPGRNPKKKENTKKCSKKTS